MERPATSRLPIVSKYPGAKLLKRRSGAQRALGHGNVLHVERVAVVLAVHRDRRGETDGGHAGHLRQSFRDALVRARRLLWIADEACWYRDCESLDLLRAREARFDLAHGDERANHQPRDDQQHQGERDLRHDQRVARAVSPGGIAGRSASFLERRGVRCPESQDGNAGRTERRSARRWPVRRAAPSGRGRSRPHAAARRARSLRSRPIAGLGEHQAERAARESQQHALRQQPARDAATTRPKRRAHGELLLASLRADEKQVRYVPAGDEQHDADRRQENPEDLARRRRSRHRPAGARSAAALISRRPAAGARSCAPRRRWPGPA